MDVFSISPSYFSDLEFSMWKGNMNHTSKAILDWLIIYGVRFQTSKRYSYEKRKAPGKFRNKSGKSTEHWCNPKQEEDCVSFSSLRWSRTKLGLTLSLSSPRPFRWKQLFDGWKYHGIVKTDNKIKIFRCGNCDLIHSSKRHLLVQSELCNHVSCVISRRNLPDRVNLVSR